jgi:hypothetical protein
MKKEIITLFERPQDRGKLKISKVILEDGKEIDFGKHAYFLVFDGSIVYGENEFSMSFGFNNQDEAMCLSESASMFNQVIQLMAKYDIGVKSAFEKIFKRERERENN